MNTAMVVAGVALMALPFVVLFVHMLAVDGLKAALWVWGASFTVAGVITVGVVLFETGLHR